MVCKVQAYKGLAELEGQEQVSPLLSGGRTRLQPEGEMGASHFSELKHCAIGFSFRSQVIILTIALIIQSSG
jgi:hypothetical protein